MVRQGVRALCVVATLSLFVVGCGQSGNSAGADCTWTYARDTAHRRLDIFSMRHGREHQLTDDQSSWDPTLSPDGEWIVFTRGSGGFSDSLGWEHTELYIMDVDGGGQRQMLNDPGDDHSPVWSPDGSMIAFVRTVPHKRDPEGHLLMVAPVSGDEPGTPRTVAETTSFDTPAWSPDSTRLAWAETEGIYPQKPQSRIRWTAITGGESDSLDVPADLRGAYSIVWDADGGHFVFSARMPATVAPPSSGAPVPLPPDTEPELIRLRIADSSMKSLGVPVRLPARIGNGRIAGVVDGRKNSEASRIVLVNPDGGGYETVIELQIRFPYRGMSIGAVCPD